MAAPAGGKQKHAVGISRNPPEPSHMLTRNQIDGMDVEIRRNLTCYGGLSQPATQNTNTWLCQPVAHKREIKSMGWSDGRLGGYAGGSMEMDRWIYGRMDGRQFFCCQPLHRSTMCTPGAKRIGLS